MTSTAPKKLGLDRRRFAGIACSTLALYACGDKKAKSSKPAAGIREPASGFANAANSGACLFSSDDRVNLESISSDLPQALAHAILVYPPSAQSTVVVDFGTYAHRSAMNIGTVVICTSDGRLLGVRGIAAADVRADDRLIPLVFDGIDVEGLKDLVVLVFLADEAGTAYRSQPHALNATAKFRDQAVKDVDSWAALTSDQPSTALPQGLAIAPVLTKTESDQIAMNVGDPSFYWDNGIKKFLGDNRYQPAELLRGMIVCDLANHVLAEDGAAFTDFVNCPEFVVYKLVDDSWLRLMVRVI